MSSYLRGGRKNTTKRSSIKNKSLKAILDELGKEKPLSPKAIALKEQLLTILNPSNLFCPSSYVFNPDSCIDQDDIETECEDSGDSSTIDSCCTSPLKSSTEDILALTEYEQDCISKPTNTTVSDEANVRQSKFDEVRLNQSSTIDARSASHLKLSEKGQLSSSTVKISLNQSMNTSTNAQLNGESRSFSSYLPVLNPDEIKIECKDIVNNSPKNSFNVFDHSSETDASFIEVIDSSSSLQNDALLNKFVEDAVSISPSRMPNNQNLNSNKTSGINVSKSKLQDNSVNIPVSSNFPVCSRLNSRNGFLESQQPMAEVKDSKLRNKINKKFPTFFQNISKDFKVECPVPNFPVASLEMSRPSLNFSSKERLENPATHPSFIERSVDVSRRDSCFRAHSGSFQPPPLLPISETVTNIKHINNHEISKLENLKSRNFTGETISLNCPLNFQFKPLPASEVKDTHNNQLLMRDLPFDTPSNSLNLLPKIKEECRGTINESPLIDSYKVPTLVTPNADTNFQSVNTEDFGSTRNYSIVNNAVLNTLESEKCSRNAIEGKITLHDPFDAFPNDFKKVAVKQEVGSTAYCEGNKDSVRCYSCNVPDNYLDSKQEVCNTRKVSKIKSESFSLDIPFDALSPPRSVEVTPEVFHEFNSHLIKQEKMDINCSCHADSFLANLWNFIFEYPVDKSTLLMKRYELEKLQNVIDHYLKMVDILNESLEFSSTVKHNVSKLNATSPKANLFIGRSLSGVELGEKNTNSNCNEKSHGKPSLKTEFEDSSLDPFLKRRDLDSTGDIETHSYVSFLNGEQSFSINPNASFLGTDFKKHSKEFRGNCPYDTENSETVRSECVTQNCNIPPAPSNSSSKLKRSSSGDIKPAKRNRHDERCHQPEVKDREGVIHKKVDINASDTQDFLLKVSAFCQKLQVNSHRSPKQVNL